MYRERPVQFGCVDENILLAFYFYLKGNMVAFIKSDTVMNRITHFTACRRPELPLNLSFYWVIDRCMSQHPTVWAGPLPETQKQWLRRFKCITGCTKSCSICVIMRFLSIILGVYLHYDLKRNLNGLKCLFFNSFILPNLINQLFNRVK